MEIHKKGGIVSYERRSNIAAKNYYDWPAEKLSH